MRNLITDVVGVRVGNAEDAALGSGVTTIIFDRAVTGSVDVRGGGPGTRETALLDPAQTVEGIDAIVLSGGSAFGLDAASGVQAWLREQGRGFRIRDAVVPIVLTKDASGNSVAEGSFTIKRLDYRIGDADWADPDTVANEVVVRVRMVLPPVR